MATDIKISELNELGENKLINQVIVNDRNTESDPGVSKRISLSNFLPSLVVEANNINNNAIITSKIADCNVTTDKIADLSITSVKIANGGVTNDKIDTNAVNNSSINNLCNFEFNQVCGTTSITSPIITSSSKLTVNTGCFCLRNIDYQFPVSQLAGKFLKTDGAGNLTWEDAVPGSGTSLVFDQIFPVGTILAWGGGGGSVPADGKWLAVDGTSKVFDGDAYPELAAILGTTWGPRYTDATGATGTEDVAGRYYSLPNLGGRVIMGSGTGVDINGVSCTATYGLTGGEYSHALTIAEMPTHRHTFNINACYGFRDVLQNPACFIAAQCRNTPIHGACAALNDQNYINECGNGDAHNNVQPHTTIKYIIKAKNDDVQSYNITLGPGLSGNLDAAGTCGQASCVTLSSTDLGIKITDDFGFDGSSRLTLNDNLSASSIRFDDGSVQDTANTIIAGSVQTDGSVNTGTGFTSVRSSEGRYTITLPDPGTGKIWHVTANAHSVNTNPTQWYSTSFTPHTVELEYINTYTIKLNVKIPNYHGVHVAQYDDAAVNFIAVKSDS